VTYIDKDDTGSIELALRDMLSLYSSNCEKENKILSSTIKDLEASIQTEMKNIQVIEQEGLGETSTLFDRVRHERELALAHWRNAKRKNALSILYEYYPTNSPE